ncbi:BTB/POZ domain-containing protein KCTD12 [Hypsibius exemplaris]|uniref:BTB/POZ domain-containing protein KCTD12 n=1 Tax=Hypsibius exemplaris TaxID=2072580 RepID=A0A1W0WSS4_HYPEX|nr:BTB/POZ domain-containing protein KCTD12 [Hypsibius exemplaris]
MESGDNADGPSSMRRQQSQQPVQLDDVAPVTLVEGFIYGTEIIELNVGGVLYTTTINTLLRDNESLLARMFASNATVSLPKDAKGRLFLDRDGVLFRYVLDFLRHGRLVLPENFYERERLRAEAEHFKLCKMIKNLDSSSGGASAAAIKSPGCSLLPNSNHNQNHRGSMFSLTMPQSPSSAEFLARMAFVTVGYRGTFFGNMGHAEVKDVKFRKLSRILIHGKVAVCREVFGDTLNESRDPDRGANDRYSSRFFLKHNHLEQAFDQLGMAGFRMVCGCASGTNSSYETPKPGSDNEENKWQHYNEYVFNRT